MTISFSDEQLREMFSSFTIDVNQSVELSVFQQEKILLEYFNGRLTQVNGKSQSVCYSFEVVAYFM